MSAVFKEMKTLSTATGKETIKDLGACFKTDIMAVRLGHFGIKKRSVVSFLLSSIQTGRCIFHRCVKVTIAIERLPRRALVARLVEKNCVPLGRPFPQMPIAVSTQAQAKVNKAGPHTKPECHEHSEADKQGNGAIDKIVD